MSCVINQHGRLSFLCADDGGEHPATQRGTPQTPAPAEPAGPRSKSNGSSMSMKTIQQAVERAARRAKVKPGVHILRHTFCSHLAMKGAVPRQIQELAGHKDLSTTMRYMHLSPLSRRQAIQLLDAPVPGKQNIRETGSKKSGIRKFPKEMWWRRRESNPRPKARRRGTLHACPRLFSRARREDAAKTARHQPRKISRPRAEAPRGHQPV